MALLKRVGRHMGYEARGDHGALEEGGRADELYGVR